MKLAVFALEVAEGANCGGFVTRELEASWKEKKAKVCLMRSLSEVD